ncbi:18863_t:CDS:1, partial [Entrophospora sp. SA101]
PISKTQEKSSNQVDEQEWVKFQKLISKETQLSHQIADADEEELQKDRDEMQE